MRLANLIYGGHVSTSVLDEIMAEKTRGYYIVPGTKPVVRYKVRQYRAHADIRAYVASLDHDFGIYTANFEMSRGETVMTVTGGEEHPHYDGVMCWGNMGAARSYALRRHDIETATGLAAVVLTSYNPDDAYGGWWKDEEYDYINLSLDHGGNVHKCVSCGETEIWYRCTTCGGNLCRRCAVKCLDAYERHSGQMFCADCVRDKVCIGKDCRHTVCVRHPNHQSPFTTAKTRVKKSLINERSLYDIAAALPRETEGFRIEPTSVRQEGTRVRWEIRGEDAEEYVQYEFIPEHWSASGEDTDLPPVGTWTSYQDADDSWTHNVPDGDDEDDGLPF